MTHPGPPELPTGYTGESDPASGPIAAGDRLAAAGQWPEAIDAWAQAMNTSAAGLAASRIQWFLRETTSAGPRTPPSRHLLNPVVIGVVAAALGTGGVLIAQSIGDGWSYPLGVLAWGCYIVAAIAGLVYARRHTPVDEPAISHETIERARRVARTLDSGSDTIAANSWHQA